MAEIKISSPNIKVGRTGAVIVVLLVLGLYGFAILRSFSNFEDPALEEMIRTELGTDLGGRTLESLEQMRESGDYSGLEEQLEMFDDEAIQILRMNLSRPALGCRTAGGEPSMSATRHRNPPRSRRGIFAANK